MERLLLKTHLYLSNYKSCPFKKEMEGVGNKRGERGEVNIIKEHYVHV
jgi:hypothetical protein